MKVPKKLSVFGREYKIVFKKGLSDSTGNLDGLCCPNGIIYLDDSLKGSNLAVTLEHEKVHALLDRSGISPQISDDLEEIIAVVFSQYMVESFNIRYHR